MNTIDVLVCGIAAAANGTAALNTRGSSSPAVYYKDFEATQQFSATPIALDSSGSAVIYVNSLVDVLVYDVNGFLVREFTAGSAAPNVEVISQSFTGTSYSDGSSGTSKPTTLQKVLDSWLTSAGSADFKVLSGGVATNLSSLQGLYFNVKSYGAIGNGSANDTAAITAAIAAATTLGGIVFFPPGTYRVVSQITVPAGVSILGCGGTSSHLVADVASANHLMEFTGGDAGKRKVDGMWFGAINQMFTPALTGLVAVSGTGAQVHFSDCLFGNDNFVFGELLGIGSTGATSIVVVEQCTFRQRQNRGIIQGPGGASVGRVKIVNCDLDTTLVGAYTFSYIIALDDGLTVSGCVFTMSSINAGTVIYIEASPLTALGGVQVFDCLFKGDGGGLMTPIALRNDLAVPSVDFVERGNVFSGALPVVLAYKYTTDGYAGAGSFGDHGSRIGRSATYLASNGNQVLTNVKEISLHTIQRTGAGAQVISADTLGRHGDRLTVEITNNTGAIVAPTFGANMAVRAGYVANIPNGAIRTVEFMWLPNILVAGAGIWLQTAIESG